MKMHTWPLLVIMLAPFVLAGCYTAPEFPVTPSISYESLRFKAGDVDTLTLRVKFQDGDGDLGLSGDELFPPYEQYLIVRKPNGDFYKPGDNDTLNYNCKDFKAGLIIGGDTLTKDTVYAPVNINYFNIYADLYVKERGEFVKYDFGCVQPIGWGRFPRLKDNFNADSPLEGVIEYNIRSSSWLFLFSNDTLKMEITIRDRALHLSNQIETPEFTLLGLTDENNN